MTDSEMPESYRLEVAGMIADAFSAYDKTQEEAKRKYFIDILYAQGYYGCFYKRQDTSTKRQDTSTKRQDRAEMALLDAILLSFVHSDPTTKERILKDAVADYDSIKQQASPTEQEEPEATQDAREPLSRHLL